MPSSSTATTPQKVLIIGAYGLIGYGITKQLSKQGHQITGLGRNLQTALRVVPDIPWVIRDLATLLDAQAWRQILGGFTSVVNCSGALQDGPEDHLEKLQHRSVAALALACASEQIALVQISSVGASLDARSSFLSSKGRGDNAIRLSGVKFYIFRPGLVLANHAYGGTSMLRMLAAFPWIQPIAMPHAAIQTVWLDDVAGAVAAAVDGRLAHGFETDLVESEVHTLRDVLAAIRHWLGFAPARFELSVPHALTTAIAKGADALSQLGWRSPLRSTAISVLAQGVRGKPADLSFAGLPAPSSLDQTLSQMSVGAQDRLHARMSLLAPFMVLSLGLFWWASGVIGLVQVKQAALVLEKVGWSNDLAIAGVVFWAMVDMAIGTAFAIRQHSQAACWASAGVSVFYLLASTMTIPSLWMDPLGPLVKVVPVIVLSLVTSAALDTR